MSPEASAPPAPSRVRVVRPQFYRSAVTGSLRPDVRDCLIGLMTVADDEGWLLWSLDELATTMYPYTPPRRRLRDLEARADVLVAAGLLVIETCGCAHLPTLKEHHGIKGGRQTTPIWGWHQPHAVDGRVRTGTAAHVPSSSSVSSSSSSSDSVKASSSSPARANGARTARYLAPRGEISRTSSPARANGAPAVCLDCRRPIATHAADCPVRQNPMLAVVAE